MRKKGTAENIIERVARLNQDWHEGCQIRGYHMAPTLYRTKFWKDVVGKKEFIDKHGRDAWNRLPKFCLVRCGKRVYVTRAAVDDCMWLWKERK